MCFWRCPCWKKLLNNVKMLVRLFLLHNFLHNHMRYTYRQIYDLKEECRLSETRFLQTSPNEVLSVRARHTRRLHWVWVGNRLRAGPAAPPVPCPARCLERHTNFRVTTELIPWSSACVSHSSSSSSSSSPSDKDAQGRICR